MYLVRRSVTATCTSGRASTPASSHLSRSPLTTKGMTAHRMARLPCTSGSRTNGPRQRIGFASSAGCTHSVSQADNQPRAQPATMAGGTRIRLGFTRSWRHASADIRDNYPHGPFPPHFTRGPLRGVSMDFWILGVGALVLIGLAVWIVWPTAAAPVADPAKAGEFEDEYTSATADLS